MTCRDATDFLGAYLSRDLAPDVHAAFERHLALCVNCRRFLQQYEQTVAAGRAACEACDDAPVPDELVRAILNSIRGGG
jgi:anti-sigma factor RsiW